MSPSSLVFTILCPMPCLDPGFGTWWSYDTEQISGLSTQQVLPAVEVTGEGNTGKRPHPPGGKSPSPDAQNLKFSSCFFLEAVSLDDSVLLPRLPSVQSNDFQTIFNGTNFPVFLNGF